MMIGVSCPSDFDYTWPYFNLFFFIFQCSDSCNENVLVLTSCRHHT